MSRINCPRPPVVYLKTRINSTQLFFITIPIDLDSSKNN